MKAENVKEHLEEIRKRLNILAEAYRTNDRYIALVQAYHDFIDALSWD